MSVPPSDGVPRAIPAEHAHRVGELAPGAVVVDADGDCAQQGPPGAWWWVGDHDPVDLETFLDSVVWPLVVVWEPVKPEHTAGEYWAWAPGDPTPAGPDDSARTVDDGELPGGRPSAPRQKGSPEAPPSGSRRRRWWLSLVVVPLCLAGGLAIGLAIAAALT